MDTTLRRWINPVGPLLTARTRATSLDADGALASRLLPPPAWAPITRPGLSGGTWREVLERDVGTDSGPNRRACRHAPDHPVGRATPLLAIVGVLYGAFHGGPRAPRSRSQRDAVIGLFVGGGIGLALDYSAWRRCGHSADE